MQEPNPVWPYPHAFDTTLLLLASGFLGLLAGAVVFDQWRRRRERQRQIAADWDTVERIAAEKGLSQEELRLMRELIARWYPKAPLKPLTVRKEFEACVQSALDDARERGGIRAFERIGVELRDVRERLGLGPVPVGHPMHSTRDLPEGQLVYIRKREGAAAEGFPMRVREVHEAFWKAEPAGTGRTGPPKANPGDALVCGMWRDEDARYAFTATLHRAEGDPPLWVFEHAPELHRKQEREFYRVPFNQGVQVDLLNAPVDDSYEGVTQRPAVSRTRARVTSLSAGGVALVMNAPLPRQVCLRITLTLPGSQELTAAARVVSTAPLSGGRTLVRATFVDLDEETQDSIARFVMERQQQQLAASSGKETQ